MTADIHFRIGRSIHLFRWIPENNVGPTSNLNLPTSPKTKSQYYVITIRSTTTTYWRAIVIFLPASRSFIVFGPRSGEMWHYHYCRARRNKFSICMNTSYPDIRLDYTGNTKTHKTVDDRTRAEKKKTGYNVKGMIWYTERYKKRKV